MDEMTLREFSPIKELELRALRCANLAGPALKVDRNLLARLLVERERILSMFESARMLIDELEDAGLIGKSPDEATDIARYAVALRRYACDLE